MIFYFLSITYDFLMPILCKRLNLPASLSNQLPAYLSYFIAGMFFVINWDFLNQHIAKFIFPAITVIILHFFTKTSFLLPIALCVVVMFFAFRLPVLNNIGKTDYSYGMYLVHYPIILILNYYNLFGIRKLNLRLHNYTTLLIHSPRILYGVISIFQGRSFFQSFSVSALGAFSKRHLR